ncbi:MAG TPA: asparagine synthase (glutamine-hydrolyzing) [Tepidisphaeraceae bacterium]
MCGFAGVIAWNDRFRTSRHSLASMQAAIAHRGPDGQAMYFNHEAEVTPSSPHCAMAFCRLAILDPDPRAMQPFHLFDTNGQPRMSMVFNGEIYNFPQLKAELKTKRPDYPWRTECDTEVLLLAYDAWREGCLDRLDGMFAFAIWDHQERSLSLARDRMGQKPLYVAHVDGAVAFASELGALTRLPWMDRTINNGALADYLTWGYIGGTQTIYAGAEKILPATWKKFTSGSSTNAHYFNPNLPNLESRAVLGRGIFSSNPVSATRQLVLDAVHRQMISDVPIGSFLSGGIDSSIIALAMTRAAKQPIHTFSIGFDEPEYDESSYAAAVAKHLGSIHHEFHVLPDAAVDLPKLAKAFGEPFGDSSALPTHYLSRETRAHVKVALSGDGGDELFAGYDRYRAMRLSERFRHFLPKLTIPVAHALNGGRPKSRRLRMQRFLAALHLPPPERYAAYVRLFDERLLSALWPSGPSPLNDIAAEFAKLSFNRDIVQTALATDRITYLPDDLLTKLDRASMLHALEVRSPFMDPALMTFAAALTTSQLLSAGSKTLLRKAFASELPAEVFDRKKMGFAIPIGSWFRTSLRDMLHQRLFDSQSFATQHFNLKIVQQLVDEHQSHRVDHSQRLYALLMLELWWEIQRNLTTDGHR